MSTTNDLILAAVDYRHAYAHRIEAERDTEATLSRALTNAEARRIREAVEREERAREELFHIIDHELEM